MGYGTLSSLFFMEVSLGALRWELFLGDDFFLSYIGRFLSLFELETESPYKPFPIFCHFNHASKASRDNFGALGMMIFEAEGK